MATAADTFTWADYGTPIKAWLGVSGSSEDVVLQSLLEAAAVDCDNFCGWYYTDEDDEIVDQTPTDPGAEPMIKLGVYEWVKAARAMYSSPAAGGVTVVKTGQLSESYGNNPAGVNAINLARRAAYPLWESAVYAPLRMGKAR